MLYEERGRSVELDEAVPLQQLVDGSDSERTAFLHPIRDVVKEYGRIGLDDAGVACVRNGQRFKVNTGLADIVHVIPTASWLRWLISMRVESSAWSVESLHRKKTAELDN